ncbi:putative molybdopterin biosynthesis protein [Methanohalophilus levihalophilus]|uniref:molybdenum cofactor synthesis domain-containing protein n=1 Tax=Methanohalophilus levihalophilus TaxID=1431282 RepID=UPI001AE64D1C|nr:gephyrin-like molybdotransferase Glp [Methanohalophilus levihalophilus]MBP2030657.1 putative molybdopterin biosynthesis protein [Methanohalophilus levihalophilus]
MRKILRDLTPFGRARQIMLGLSPGFVVEALPIIDIAGLVLAEDIISDINVPPFSKSLKDGYAVHASDTKDASSNPVSLVLKDYIPAGRGDSLSVNSGETYEISTGAPLPDGADAVVMVEDTELKDGNVVVKKAVNREQNVLLAGADISSGKCVLNAGERLSPAKIGVLAAIGKSSAPIRILRVGIIATGDELTDPGTSLAEGSIYNTNTYTLSAAVRRLGATPVSYGIVKDNRRVAEDVFLQALDECDIVLTTGSTSAGQDDFMYDVIGQYGRILVHGVNFKPGKPVIIAEADDIPVMGLPGNPTSALMIFNELVAELICSGLGITVPFRKKVKGELMADIYSDTRLDLYTVRLEGGSVYPADKTSAAITTLADADGFISIDPEVTFLPAGSKVEVTLFDDF